MCFFCFGVCRSNFVFCHIFLNLKQKRIIVSIYEMQAPMSNTGNNNTNNDANNNNNNNGNNNIHPTQYYITGAAINNHPNIGNGMANNGNNSHQFTNHDVSQMRPQQQQQQQQQQQGEQSQAQEQQATQKTPSKPATGKKRGRTKGEFSTYFVTVLYCQFAKFEN